MDTETIERVKRLIRQVAEEEGTEIERLVVFGSRSREDWEESSDVDIMIVSPDFQGVAWNRRPGPFYEAWDYEELPVPEFLCLTPEEFKEKKRKKPNIVRTAVEEGVKIG